MCRFEIFQWTRNEDKHSRISHICFVIGNFTDNRCYKKTNKYVYNGWFDSSSSIVNSPSICRNFPCIWCAYMSADSICESMFSVLSVFKGGILSNKLMLQMYQQPYVMSAFGISMAFMNLITNTWSPDLWSVWYEFLLDRYW